MKDPPVQRRVGASPKRRQRRRAAANCNHRPRDELDRGRPAVSGRLDVSKHRAQTLTARTSRRGSAGRHSGATPRHATVRVDKRSGSSGWPTLLVVGALGVGSAIAGTVALASDDGAVARGRLVSAAQAPVPPDEARTLLRERLVEQRAAAVSRSQRRESRVATERAEVAAADRVRALAEFGRRADRRAAYLAGPRWVSPMASYDITATFGQTSYLWSTVHTGVDLAAPTGTSVMAVGDASVVDASYDGAYGNKVVLLHDDGTQTWYAHLDSISVTAGERVEAGDLIGGVGATGNVTGPHLHLEFRPGGGDPVDPVIALAGLGVAL